MKPPRFCSECGIGPYSAKGLCHRCYERKRYQENPEPQRARERLKYQANPEPQRTRERLKYQANPEPKKEAARRYAATHPEKIKARSRTYQASHHESLVLTKRAYYLAHREERLQAARAYYAAHRDERCNIIQRYYTTHRNQILAQQKAMYVPRPRQCKPLDPLELEARRQRQRERERAYRLAHQESRASMARAWRIAHPEVKRESEHRRRAQKRQQPHERISHSVIYARDKGICQICGKHVERASMSLDHIVPLSRGGSHTFTNVQTSHRLCNFRKQATGYGQPRLL